MRPQEAKDILQTALSLVKADHAELALSGFTQAATRYANNAITQNLAQANTTLTVRVAFGQRVGSASINSFTPDALRQVVERAEALARQAEPDTEYLPPLEPQTYREVPAFASATAEYTPDQRAAAVQAVTQICAVQGLTAAGNFTTQHGFTALANSRGLFGYHRSSGALFTCTAMTEDSSGWAAAISEDVTAIEVEKTAELAVQKALAARHPREAEPGRYKVVLEPAAVAEMMAWLALHLDAKAADEGRSAFSGKEGEPIAAASITLRSDPAHPACPTTPFFGDGLPVPKVTWIESGVLKMLSTTRFWAQKTNRPVTGPPTNLILEGGEATVEELVAGVERGLLVTRFWYIRLVDPMRLLLTGMTRDGLFWIEAGKVQYGVKNLRFNFSPLDMLKNVVALGRPERTGDYLPAYVPPLAVEDFPFTSGTEF
ncbi:MAG TPA: TldD/PmbA family protein [Armatimonadetes bacterium]|nr:TldD/PmbA family protein [Armatimonadota bacterium]